MSLRWYGTILFRGAAAGGAAATAYLSGIFHPQRETDPLPVLKERIPARSEQIAALHKSSFEDPFDILVIGGGATGCGIALDAATRGLKVALVEKEDFASGTSSKSTKLLHGGVRYLEKAFKKLDISQLKLVYSALDERAIVLKVAPHLAHALPTLTPCYNWLELPYYWAGLKVYDVLAGREMLVPSRLLSVQQSLSMLPTLAPVNPSGKTLKGAIVYYDGQMDDARLNLALATTSARAGAAVVNHAEVTKLTVSSLTGKVDGAIVKDNISGKPVTVAASVVVNATGPYCDRIRLMSSQKASPIVLPSMGVHVSLPEYYGSTINGLIIPKTEDGRVIFMLPWKGIMIAGTTDAPCATEDHPKPNKEAVEFILKTLEPYLSVNVRKEDVKSVWCGIRPLIDLHQADATDDSVQKSENIVREHYIEVDDNGLITICGGKWTTYRRMAEELVDTCVTYGSLVPLRSCITSALRLTGADDHSPVIHSKLAQQFVCMERNSQGRLVPIQMSTDVAVHLAKAYGDRAFDVARIAQNEALGTPLIKGIPVIEAEVAYAARQEYCETVIDFLDRRTHLTLIDPKAAVDAVPKVTELLKKEHHWTSSRAYKEAQSAKDFLQLYILEKL